LRGAFKEAAWRGLEYKGEQAFSEELMTADRERGSLAAFQRRLLMENLRWSCREEKLKNG
jgi:hypothetical protein